ncbi:MAG: SPASM domain-containing protein [Bacilli bacterium]|nr:SPASM domain-containing protein [Bacilli bacterium]
MFKKVYVEITNNCNLHCSFCAYNKRPQKFVSLDEFNIILEKLEGYTNHLYLHVLGEPLLHPHINELIDLASKRYQINITTNGYLIARIIDNQNIRQLNISLHSFHESNKLSLKEYLRPIFEVAAKLSRKTYINYRLWIKNEHTQEILQYLNEEYKTNLTLATLKKNTTLAPNIFLNINKEFLWPSVNNNLMDYTGTCYALRDHIAILVDGTVVPCCLDAEGIINLGNIYNSALEDIIKGKRYQQMLTCFKENKKCEELCQHCNFIDK